MAEVPEEWFQGLILGRKDVAEVFNVTPETVARWARTGMIGFFRTPKGNRCFPECEIERMKRGEPVSDIVVELAEADRLHYKKKWQEGWRQNPMTTAAWRNAGGKKDGETP